MDDAAGILVSRDHKVSLGDKRVVEQITGVCGRQIDNLVKSGRFPKPIRLGRSVRWNVSELYQWIEAGCPAADVWAERREGAAR